MKEYEYLDELISRYPVLAPVKADIRTAYETLKECYERGGKLLIAGNGGSCADSEHIVGELMKGFVKKRPVSEEIEKALKTVDPQMGAELSEKLQQGLPAIALTGHAGLTTAFMNDGNSKNVLYAAVTAKAKGLKVIGLLGRDGGRIRGYSDTAIVVPEQETFKIQELHLPVYHALCLMLEEYFF